MAQTTCTADAAVRLMLKFPFWSELYYSMSVHEDSTIPTLCTDGRNMWVNPEFWKTMTLNLKISALAHEVTHKMLLHCSRRGHRNPMLWNIAADYVVNCLLAENGMEIGKDWIHDMKYVGWSVEAVYSDLEKQAEQKQPQPQPQPGGDEGDQESENGEKSDEGAAGPGSGEGEEDGEGEGEGSGADGEPTEAKGDGDGPASEGKPQSNGSGGGGASGAAEVDVPGVTKQQQEKYGHDIKEVTGSKEEIEKYEQEVQQAVQKAIMTARAAGKVPSNVEMAMDDAYEAAKEPWFNHLHRYMQSLTQSEYNWAKTNKKMGAVHGFFAPDHYSESLGEIVIAIDASGSVFNAADQCGFAQHTNAIFGEAKPERVHVVYFDAKVQRVDVYEHGEMDFTSRPKGGGGTDFRPIFEYIEEEGIAPVVVIILTDTEGTFPMEAPEYPVIWASVYDQGNAPFGEVIYVE